MKVRYSVRAIAELEAIAAYLRPRSPRAADTLVQAIKARIAKLEHSPWMGPATDEQNARELTVIGYPYKIFYEVEGEEIWIVHIRHTSRRPWRAGED